MHDGEVARSARMDTFMRPFFGFGDEARLVFREHGRAWGAMALFVAPTTCLSPATSRVPGPPCPRPARGVRVGMLSRLADARPPADPAARP